MRLTDDELRNLCEQEITSAVEFSADLATERTNAMDAYLGEELGNEVEGRSGVVTREVLDTIEWVTPSLVRIFADAENVCLFEPEGPEDEEAAQQESDAIQHVFWKQTDALVNLTSFIKDGLLQKNGILKVWWDATPRVTREEYKGLSDWELSELLQDEGVEVIEHEMDERGHHVTCEFTKSNGEIKIAPVPPEEFGISRAATSIVIDDAPFVFHRTRMTKAQLVDMGYDWKMVKELPGDEGQTYGQERLARRYLSDEQSAYEESNHWSLEGIWLTECYLRIDRNGDGKAALHKVTLAGQESGFSSGSTLLDVEEVDCQPFVTWTPVLRPHTFYGLSLADLVIDLQSIKTVLTRQIIDSTFLATNGRTAVNDLVNLDDLLTSRPGGVVRVAGDDPPQNSLMPIAQQPVPPQSFEMLSYLDEMRQRRTGVGDEVGALDGGELANINTGVAALAYDASRSKIELMARLCAEVGIRPLFLRMHELLRKNSGDKDLALRMRGGWAQVRPQEWRERTDMTVTVGVGKVSRERRLIALGDVLEKQAKAVEGGGLGTLLTAEHLYKSATDYTRELGLEETLYWQDPKDAQPQQPAPDYQAALLQIQQASVEAQMQKNQVEAMKVSSSEKIQVAQLQQKEREMQSRVEVQRLTTDLGMLKAEREQSEKGSKTMLDAEIKAREQELKMAEMRLKDEQEQAKREVDVYKALIASSTTLTKEQMGIVGVEGPPVEEPIDVQAIVASMSGELGELRAQLHEEREKANAPKLVKRDKNGLIVAIGDKTVKRDVSGRVEAIG